jgi:uncharacterized protein YeaO (DUF488 family)
MATRKPAVPLDEKFENVDLDIFKVLEAVDKKDYSWYSKLTEEQQKKFVPYVITHWMSAINATGMLGAYYTMSTDSNANRHLFNERITQHPELQWLMLCAASPGMGKQFHQWIPHLNAKFGELKVKATKKDAKEYFEKIYKGASKEDITLITEAYVTEQNHQYRLSELYPDMKIDDIRALSKIVTSAELDKYEAESGY